MKHIHPIGSDGAFLTPPDYQPDNAQTTAESWESWTVSVALQNFNEAAVVLMRPLVEKVAAFAKEFTPLVQHLASEFEDSKAKARQRVKDDVRRKRKEIMKRRGNR